MVGTLFSGDESAAAHQIHESPQKLVLMALGLRLLLAMAYASQLFRGRRATWLASLACFAQTGGLLCCFL